MKNPQTILLAAFALAAITALGCSDLETRTPPTIELTPSTLAFTDTILGDTQTRPIQVRNVGTSTLRVTDMQVDVTTDFLTLDFEGPFNLEPGEERTLQVTYAPTDPVETSGAILAFSNDPQNSPAAIVVQPSQPRPGIVARPAAIDFGIVAVGQERREPVRVRNNGTAPLILCDVELRAGGQYTTDIMEVAAAEGRIETIGDADYIVLPAPTEEDDAELEFDVIFGVVSPGATSGALLFLWDEIGDVDNACTDAAIRDPARVDFQGTGATSELSLSPCPLDFGETAINGTGRRTLSLRNDQPLPLDIFSVRIDANRSDPGFSIETALTLPLTLQTGDVRDVTVAYRPLAQQASAGVVVVEHSNADGERVESLCPIAGVGVERECPFAVGEAFLRELPQRRGSEVSWAVPLQTLVLDGTNSFSPTGAALTHEWRIVSQPADAIRGLQPYEIDPSNDALRQFFLPVTGEYVFALRVFDDTGLESCDDALVRVDATPDRQISVELTWRNPDDPDETNQDGSDLDLHFLKVGPGRWFQEPWDVFFGNRNAFWEPEEPSLDFDVRNGLGPETITLDNPTDCQYYAIGVHYFEERWGTALANIRIFIDGAEIYSRFAVPLQRQEDFWDVGRLHWPSGEFFEADPSGRPVIISSFDADAAIAPPSTSEIDSLGQNDPCFAYP